MIIVAGAPGYNNSVFGKRARLVIRFDASSGTRRIFRYGDIPVIVQPYLSEELL